MRQQSVSMVTPVAQKQVLKGRSRLGRFDVTSIGAMTLLVILTIYFLVPYFWLIFSSTKNAGDLFGTFSQASRRPALRA